MVNRTANDRSAGVGGVFQEESQEEPKGESDVGEVLFEGSVEEYRAVGHSRERKKVSGPAK